MKLFAIAILRSDVDDEDEDEDKNLPQ